MAYRNGCCRANCFVHENDNWSGYKVFIAPLQFLMTEEFSATLHAYVKQGNTLMLDFRSDVKDGRISPPPATPSARARCTASTRR